LTAWTDRFLVESGAQVGGLSRAPDSTQRLYVPGAAVSRAEMGISDPDPEGGTGSAIVNRSALGRLTAGENKTQSLV